MNALFPFSVKTHAALRAKLAVFMVLAILLTGMFNLRPTPVHGHRAGTGQVAHAMGLQPVDRLSVLTGSRPMSQLGQANRQRHVGRRGARYEEIRQGTPTVDWPDLEEGAPTTPRFFFRKIPSDDASDADADAPHAPATGYHSRAPPTMAKVRPRVGPAVRVFRPTWGAAA